MKILGISPLDKDATACLLVDDEVVSATAEERLSRVKIHSGSPYKAIDEIIRLHCIGSEEIDAFVYAFVDWEDETQQMRAAIDRHLEIEVAEHSSPMP